jgi:hypothetical protein
MKLAPDIETNGLRAYEQARAFERMRTWRLPASYLLFFLIPVITVIFAWKIGHMILAEFSLVMAVFLAVVSWLHWQRLQLRYSQNLGLLADLERTYGDELPWIQVEKHMAALDELKRELAEEENTD